MIFATLGITQTSLVLLSLIAKIIRFAHDFCYARQFKWTWLLSLIAKKKRVYMSNSVVIIKKETQNIASLLVSGYQDSNLGPPAPKAGALTGLRYIPFINAQFIIHNS